MNSTAIKKLLMVVLVGVCCFVAVEVAAKKRVEKQGYLNSGPSMKERYSDWGARGSRSEAVWLRKELGSAVVKIDQLEQERNRLEREVARRERERTELLEKIEQLKSKVQDRLEQARVKTERFVLKEPAGGSDKSDTAYEDIEKYFVQTRTYVVREGDTLWSIAADEEIYGDPFRWIDIYNANKKDLDSTNKEVVPGMYLKIPREEDKPVVKDDADTPAGNEKISKAQF